jgi:hypothetical protein
MCLDFEAQAAWLGTTNDGQLGSAWVSLSQLGSAWVSLGQLGSAWVSLSQLGSAWVSMGQRGSAWVSFCDVGGKKRKLPKVNAVYIMLSLNLLVDPTGAQGSLVSFMDILYMGP